MFVYFIRAGGYIKIGKADKPQERMASMQTGCPLLMEIIGTIDCRNARAALTFERKLHDQFRRLHVRGEWFRMDREILRYVGRRAKVEREMLLEEQLHILMDAKARVAMENEADP